VDWGRRAVARAYAAAAAEYTARFADEFSNVFDSDILQRFFSPLAVGSTVLDGGCGPGQLAAAAEAQGLNTVGADITIDMLAAARDRLYRPRLVCADFCELPFSDAAFDAAVCWFSVHNLPRSVTAGLVAELRRVLVVGGSVLIATHEGDAEDWFTDDHGETFAFTYYRDTELAGLLADAGFTSVATDTREPLENEHQVKKLFASAVSTADERT